jgi:hypothetical protein
LIAAGTLAADWIAGSHGGGPVSLTGAPLLVLGILASLGALVATIRYWRRGGRWRILTRTVGILVCEVLALATAGLIVNHALDDLFPSWSALFGPDRAVAAPTIVADPTTGLDEWLRGHRAEGERHGLTFEWKPVGAAAWHLPAPPVISVPPAYFTATALRFPVVLVLSPAKLAAPVADGPAIVVYLRVDRPDAMLLTQELPERLDGDLRVLARGWAVVGVGTDAGAGPLALTRAPTRFWSAVEVPEGNRPLPDVERGLPAYLDWQKSWTVPARTPDPGRLAAALHWVYPRLPAPLADPLSGPPGANPLGAQR